jgi:endonuclease/exonuclease/phosphatase family metal-dependent hydrolase
MSYNTLNFDGTSRLSDFQTVLGNSEPDILICQEISSEAGANAMLSVLNAAIGGYARSDFILDTDLNNMLYYKSSIGTLVSQDTIGTSPRVISEYVMNINGNTIRFYSCHLKSSSGSANEAERLAAVTILRNHLNGLLEGTEFIIVGDMNFYTSSEDGYQKFIADEINNIGRAQDLCTEVGSWHDNASYAEVHSQSSRYEAFGYGASGGLDDKFDFIFGNYGINNGSGIEYNSNSFTSYGNDGAHFNLSVNDGTNSAVPDSVADALYYASDHLPIYADFVSLSGTQPYLLISEYVEGSSYNKAIEIYNGTGAAVDLSAYSLEKDLNGNEVWEYTYNYNGTLANGDVFVLANSGADPVILGVADDTDNGVINFNGNDQVRLLKYGVEIDRIGIPGDITFGENVTYVRKSTVTEPQSGPQDPRSNGEWDEYPVDTFSYLGSHTAINPTITVVSPNGNEEWDRGNSYDITWTSNDFTDNVKIELYKEAVRDYTELISSTDNDGIWQWNIPSEQSISSDYKIRISDANDGNPNDESDSFFSITGTQITTDLFISEYIEGSSYNKALEIYNGTGLTVNLSEYEIWKIENGGSWTERTLALSGYLAVDSVLVIANPFASSYILDFADITWYFASCNGNDADATKDHTLVRKTSVIIGNTDWSSSAGTNATDSEWIVHNQDIFDYLGFHITGPLNAPSNVTIEISDTSITIYWDEVVGATLYHVYSSDNPYSGFIVDETGSFSNNSWVTSIISEKKFYYVTAE